MDGQCTTQGVLKKDRRWDRAQVAELLSRVQDSPEFSQRDFARQHNVPRSTFQHWAGRLEALQQTTGNPELACFLESPAGGIFLHRIMVVLHLVFGVDANCGLRRIGQFLRLTDLDLFVGASYGTQQKFAKLMEQELAAFGEGEQERLAPHMPAREITVCEDETFHPEPCLVAIEPQSGFIVLEAYRKQRDRETWNESLGTALEGLPVQVIQTVSDEARALIAHARCLGAHHSPDLFHVQQETSAATSLALQGQAHKAEQAVAQAQEAADQAVAERDACLADCPQSSAIQDLTHQAEVATEQVAQAEVKAEICRERQKRAREARRGLGEGYHPFDINTGIPCNAKTVQDRLNHRFDQLDEIAREAELSPSAGKRLGKARRVLIAMTATIAMFWSWIEDKLCTLSLSPEQERSFLEHLLSAAYLSLAASKAKSAQRRQEIEVVAEQRRQMARDGPLGDMPDEEWKCLESIATDWAALFQRSSSCVEGRNGHLSLWHHSQHRLNPSRLRALTVLANYFHRRPDGTNAAERFFRAPTSDLVQWLLERLPLPVRPARFCAA